MKPAAESALVALVTGGTSGIGLATAVRLAGLGYRNGLIARDQARGARALEVLDGVGKGPHAFVSADAADPEAFAAAITALRRDLGEPDVVFHNAGVDCVGAIDEIDLATWDLVMATNVRSAFVLLREVLPAMRRRRAGSIVVDASNSGLVARVEDPVYCASKAALVMLVRAVALEVGRDGIRINAVCPGPVRTATLDDPDASANTTALGRIAEPDEIAELVVYLLGDSARNVTGAAFPIDGGRTAGHLPRSGARS